MAEQSNERSAGGPIAAVTKYFREVRGEVRKVTWPTREEAVRLTGIVLMVTAAMTVFLFAFDYVFSTGLEVLVNTFLGI